MPLATGYLPLVLIAEDNVAILHHAIEHIARLESIAPEILTIIDITRDGESFLYSQFDGVHRCFHGIAADGTGNS